MLRLPLKERLSGLLIWFTKPYNGSNKLPFKGIWVYVLGYGYSLYKVNAISHEKKGGREVYPHHSLST